METTPNQEDLNRPALAGPLSGELSTSLFQNYLAVRQTTEALCRPLAIDDFVVQTMPEASPTKWHLAHTSWFFETFLLLPRLPGYRVFNPQFGFLFNSYYETLGSRIARPSRGLLSRPTVAEVFKYRQYVDEQMKELLEKAKEAELAELSSLVLLGLQHEQQHQELLLTDIKTVFWVNPLRPRYRSSHRSRDTITLNPMSWVSHPEGVVSIGFNGIGFSFDNERPRHRVFLENFLLASRLVTVGEYLEFMLDDGYQRPDLWLSEGWSLVQQQGWEAPLYWERHNSHWEQMTLSGMLPLNLAEPVCHVSYYEADAFARWASSRLPTEAEWELVATHQAVEGNFLDENNLHPIALAEPSEPVSQLFGDVWEWTQSGYGPYPGFKPLAGALGEYNAKFMSNQIVLRGGSCVSPRSHLRATYRNYFAPSSRWQFSGIRLARDS